MTRSVLETDGYKFSMAEAGWPLRTETFYYSHRRGGACMLPVDVESFVRDRLPKPFGPEERSFLEENQYEAGPGVRAALAEHHRVVVHALPKHSWFFPGEPVFSVSGPSALVSWLEPLLLQLNYRIQVATLALREPERLAREVARATCEEHKEVVLETLDAVEAKAPRIAVDENGYFMGVLGRVDRLQRAVGGAPDRIFEVGLRSAVCRMQHEVALRACRELKILRTSSVLGARSLGMVPVGTMGHEHVQRYGSDEAAFRAMRDRRPDRSSYLLDTFDVFRSGVPAALRLMAECLGRMDSVRYDSDDKLSQYVFTESRARQRGVRPVHIVEDEMDDAKTREFEGMRKTMNVEPERQHYGYGGFIVCDPEFGALTRDRVSAAYKLSMTGGRAVMKFSAAPGKESVPGRPVVWRRGSATGPVGIVGQADEPCPNGYTVATDAPQCYRWTGGEDWAVSQSEATTALRRDLRAARDRAIMEASLW